MRKYDGRRLVSSLLLLATSSLLYACAQSKTSKTSPPTQKVEKADRGSIEDVHLRDKGTLYQNIDDTGVVTMYLTVRRGNISENTNHSWQEVNNYSAEEYERMGVKRYQVAGLLQVGNEEGPEAGQVGYGEEVPNATVQIRGQSSSRGDQKNYKIELKKNKGSWQGQRTINLNKHYYDTMRFRNKLAFDLIEGIPQIMGLRTQFVHLYVKDETGDNPSGKFEDYGLYTQVEQVNKTSLEAHGLDRNANFYKVNDFEFYREEDTIVTEDDPKFDQDKFEKMLEIKGDRDHRKLINMLTRLNDTSVSVEELLAQDFDAENLQYWMAFQILMGNIDSQNRNMFIYSPQNSTRWYILPWDEDGIFYRTERAMRPNAYDTTDDFEKGVSNYWGNILFQRLLKSDDFRKGLDKAIADVRSYVTQKRVSEMMEAYAGVVKPYLNKLPDSMHAHLKGQRYDEVMKALPTELDKNFQEYQESLVRPQPFYIGVPKEENGKVTVAWSASYDFAQKPILYDVEVARDPEFKDLIKNQNDVRGLSITMDKLPKGQYFIRVVAKNSEGKIQHAFDRYRKDLAVLYGIKSFYVLEDGKIAGDNYDQ